jgi:2-polyprenyl-3-methyl-5-hydroxy-6-metoxy-1,4-benzoquinol methylase
MTHSDDQIADGDEVTAPADRKPTLTRLADSLAVVELHQQQRYDVTQHAISQLGERLDRLETHIATLNARPSSQAMLPPLIAPVSDALSRIELATAQRHEVFVATTGSLAERLDRLELAASAARAKQKAPPSVPPETVAAISDALSRIELATAQRHEVFVATTGSLAERLDRLELATSAARAKQKAPPSVPPETVAAISDALSRIELATAQRHEVFAATMSSLAERLDRLEAAGLQRDARADEMTTAIFASLKQLHSGGGGRIVDPSERKTLRFRDDVDAVDAEVAKIARAVTKEIRALNARSNLAPLAKNSPALATFDWDNYIHLSEMRVVQLCASLKRRKISGRVLDMGSYFGNFSLTMRRAGWHPIALDSYAVYGEAFEQHRALMRSEGIEILDYGDVGFDLAGMAPGSVDAIISMGVIEHIPHTPRLLLAAMDRVLKPGGLLAIDTPNHAYQFQRQRLAEGHSVYAPLENQFETNIPFEGHHREYTPDEMRWMMQRIGYSHIEVEMFNYSIYGLAELRGADLGNFLAMEEDPTRREIILITARKPAADQAKAGKRQKR